MKTLLDRYLDRVLVYANKPESETESIRRELQDHLLQKIDDLVATGLPRDEATLEALRRHGSPKVIGYGLRGPFPWIDIRSHGTARGVIAIGPKAVGIFAFGGVAVGVVACGTVAIGVFSGGFISVGLLIAWAFLAVGGVASATFAIGIVASGFWAMGLVADGAMAIGAWVPSCLTHPLTASYYTAQNVPPILKSLEPVLNSSLAFDRHFVIYLLAFLLLILAAGRLRHRENKRVESQDDWLMQG